MIEKTRSGNSQQKAANTGGGEAPAKPLPWFRVYHEIIDDDKLGLVAFEDRWHYIAILACKCRGLLDKGDAQEMMFRRVALKMGLATRELDEVARRLAEVGLINRETLQPLAWDERQMRSDSSRERVAAHRARKKQGSNVTETGQDTDTDAEGEKDNPSPPKGGETDGKSDPGNERETPPKAEKRKSGKEYSDEFEAAWAAYPKRSGGNSKADAFAAWKARLREGVAAADLQAGVERYAKHLRSEGKEFTVYVKQGATFFGPGEHWSADYGAPAGAGTATDAMGRPVAATSQQRSFAGTDYGAERVPSWMEDIIADSEAGKGDGVRA